MNSRHRQTLDRIFAEPVPAGLHWRDIEASLVALGAEMGEGSGSRLRVALNGVRAVFHRPHPAPDTTRGEVRAVRDFLKVAGIVPERS
jgi:hypothetical protein